MKYVQIDEADGKRSLINIHMFDWRISTLNMIWNRYIGQSKEIFQLVDALSK